MRMAYRYKKVVLPAAVSFVILLYLFYVKDRSNRGTNRQGLHDEDSSFERSQVTPEPIVYVITPTAARTTQQPDLTRLAQTLGNVQRLHWIVVEDLAVARKHFVKDLLQRTNLQTTYLNTSSEKDSKEKVNPFSLMNIGLSWIRRNIKEGVLYFASADNTYDIRLFSEIRSTQKIGLFPVGNEVVGVSSPIVKGGKIVNFFQPLITSRKFPVNIAGVSVNVAFWLDSGSPMFDVRKKDFIESQFLETFRISLTDMEPKADNCEKILVWQAQTKLKTASDLEN